MQSPTHSLTFSKPRLIRSPLPWEITVSTGRSTQPGYQRLSPKLTRKTGIIITYSWYKQALEYQNRTEQAEEYLKTYTLLLQQCYTI